MKQILSLLFIAFAINFVVDAVDFHNNLKSNYKTPWYNDNVLINPYTVAYLSINGEKSLKWTGNATKTELWLEKNYKINDKVYWTIIQKKDV